MLVADAPADRHFFMLTITPNRLFFRGTDNQELRTANRKSRPQGEDPRSEAAGPAPVPSPVSHLVFLPVFPREVCLRQVNKYDPDQDHQQPHDEPE